MQRRIAFKLALLLVAASLLPLILFGAISLWQVRRATIESVTEGNANVSRRAAEEIHQYVKNAVNVLESAAENISNADLAPWQKERILKNHVNRFDQFNRMIILDLEGGMVANSEPVVREMRPQDTEVFQKALLGQTALSRLFLKDDLTPAMSVAVPIRTLGRVTGILVAEINLLQMWRLVDQIKIGERGILHVLDGEQTGYRLIASGDGDRKKDVFQEKNFEPRGILGEILTSRGKIFENPLGVRVITVGTRLPEPLGWTVLVEQPTSEAYALATRIGIFLAGGMVGLIIVAMFFGFYGGNRSVVLPINVLMKATRELAKGNWDYRVLLRTNDEFSQLGEAFNHMAVQLGELQKKLVLQERHAMFGRIASGLAHDLKHPIQAIENVSRLMDSMHDDVEFRQTFRRTVEREFAKINLFLANLHNLTHEVPLQPVPLCLVTSLKESLATFELIAAKYHVVIERDLPSEGDLKVYGDRNSLNRVFSNLVSNAIQAMPSGGKLFVTASADGGDAVIRFKDTGMGIPPERISSLFEDFVTTKRRGLGLGLAIVRKIIQQHSGAISVESQVDVGTVFTIRMPLVRSQKR